ncbi:hypothetical protein [Bradyrhizobium sp. CCBAU 51627]|uniref:hypothetical protein n=1 Tax=Bradyrhizobium sp. CCBAU 51627 TaxID=1325088 RepID=UPI002305D896|nr:hypothetical protein [Bradyrhizobium sp. CCBAU 51627]
MQSLEPEQQFLLRELWTLAWAASVQRANLYAPGSRQTGQLRDMLQEFITTRILPHYVGSCTERQHYLNLAQLVEFGTGALPDSLRDGRYRYGVAQKLLNLVLKYHWCLGQISEPPHCPIDRIIIEKTHLRGRVNWTEIVDEDQYRAVIEAVRRKAEPESIARWELRNYRRRSSL